MNRNTLPKETIEQMKEWGFRVYMRDPDDTYALFESDDGIGFIEHHWAWGYKLSSTHHPNRDSGTGFQMFREVYPITKKMLETTAKTVRPHWHNGPLPRKYKNMEDYKSQSKWNAEYTEV